MHAPTCHCYKQADDTKRSSAPLTRALQQVAEQPGKVTRRHRAILIRSAVVYEKRAVDDHCPARKTSAAVIPFDFVVRLGLIDPFRRAMQHLTRIVQVQKQRTPAIELVGP